MYILLVDDMSYEEFDKYENEIINENNHGEPKIITGAEKQGEWTLYVSSPIGF